MKPLLILILSLLFTLTAIGQTLPDSLGFTNKAEAKNLVVNGLKEGKWIEYENNVENDEKELNALNYYKLIIYKAGKPYGIVREYYTRCKKLFMETPYINGQKNGMSKEYSESGILTGECPYSNDKENGVLKGWDLNGVLRWEMTYKNGIKSGIEKQYNTHGKLTDETMYTNGNAGEKKYNGEGGLYTVGNCESHIYNSIQTKALLIGDWGQFIITKDSIFFNKTLDGKHLKYQLDSNGLVCKNHPNCYYLAAIRDSINFGSSRGLGTKILCTLD